LKSLGCLQEIILLEHRWIL